MERQKGERCGTDNCRSRKYHLEDGQWTCSNGHVQEGRLDIREEDEYQPRKGDRRIVERDDSQTVEEKVFTGREGLALFLQAYQLILRKQVVWLIHERKFPPELELLVRDLWTLRLEAVYADRSAPRGASSSGYNSQTSQSGRESESGASQSVASERAASSQGSSMSISLPGSRSSSASRGRRAKDITKTTPKLLDTMGIIYMAAMMLQLPLDIVTVHRWITAQDIIFFRAITHIPEAMVAKMERRWRRKFEPTVLPTAEGLRREVYHLMRYYYRKFDVVVPGTNAECLLAGYVLELGCPPEVYPAVLKLAKKLNLPLRYPLSASKFNIIDCPDVQLMALMIIAVKLCYGLDGVTRYAKTPWEIANMTLDWESWKKIVEMKESDVSNGAVASRDRNWQLGVREDEIYGFTDREMDEYLDWFEKNWVKKDSSKPTAGIAKLFEDRSGEGTNPKDPNRKEASGEEVRVKLLEMRVDAFKKMQGSAKINVPAADWTVRENRAVRKVVRPGENYPRYLKWEDVSSEQLRTLYKAAAARIAVDVEGFAFVVQRLENRLWQTVRSRSRSRGKQSREGDIEFMEEVIRDLGVDEDDDADEEDEDSE
ncbi:Pol I core factor CF [Orbilia brochopaga]|uniref:Pol I core factor CF n=1 Tax=Orbilia brochopaga TaxID=3140254 RepID=A0AAV9URB1_9PEZI